MQAIADGVRSGSRRSLAQAITLVESTKSEDQGPADQLLDLLADASGDSIRVGISGSPGSGKSTLIEALGLHVIEQGHRPAVLAVDPSSAISGGSILGDKSRMERLAQSEEAFIRPSPSATTLGGVARRTREVMLLVEAAGYDVVLVETVGVGQSEIEVASMVDFFVVLLLPGSGDELQGIKKGILEHADAWVVNKADGDGRAAAEATLAEYRAATGYASREETSTPLTMTVSALTREGVEALWESVSDRHASALESGRLAIRRARQERKWTSRLARSLLLDRFGADPGVVAECNRLEEQVEAGKLSARAAARRLVGGFLDD